MNIGMWVVERDLPRPLQLRTLATVRQVGDEEGGAEQVALRNYLDCYRYCYCSRYLRWGEGTLYCSCYAKSRFRSKKLDRSSTET